MDPMAPNISFCQTSWRLLSGNVSENWDAIDQTGSCEIRDQGLPAGCIHNVRAFYYDLRVWFHVDSTDVTFKEAVSI